MQEVLRDIQDATAFIESIPDLWYVKLAAVVIVIICIVKIIFSCDKFVTSILHRKISQDKRDDQRVFTKDQKNAASQICNNRCEGTSLLFRCRHVGNDLQGDHWYPHSRGGATTINNLVMLCPSCNRKKTNHIPTRFQTAALNRRRRRGRDYQHPYFVSAGEWSSRKNRRGNRPTRSHQHITEVQTPTF